MPPSLSDVVVLKSLATLNEKEMSKIDPQGRDYGALRTTKLTCFIKISYIMFSFWKVFFCFCDGKICFNRFR